MTSNIFARNNSSNSSATNIFSSNNSSYGNRNSSYGNNNSYGNSGNNNSSYGNNSYGNNSYGNNSSSGNNSYGNNSYGNSYGNNSYGNNNNNSSGNIGSYRVERYNATNPPRQLEDINPKWKSSELNPMSIVTRPEAFHLSVTELRLEDYYLIRTQKVKRDEERYVKDAVSAGSLNADLTDRSIVSHLKEPITAKDS